MNIKFYKLIFTSLFLSCLLQTSFAQIPQDGLVGYYMFDENAEDSSGNDNHGTIVGQVNPTENRFGQASKAYLFEGGYVDAGNPLSFQLTDSMSLSAWVNLTSTDGAWSGIITKWAGNNNGFFLGVNPDNSIPRWNIGSTQAINGEPLTPAEWTHIAVTYDGDSIQLYQNGILIISDTASVPIANTTFNLTIGTQSNILNSTFNGAIDDVLIYNRGLSQTEIEMVYATQLTDTKNILFDRSVNLYPNPTNNILKIKNNSEDQILSNTLYNSVGMKLRTTDFQEEIDISNQPAGVYYLVLNFEDGSVTKKVVKE